MRKEIRDFKTQLHYKSEEIKYKNEEISKLKDINTQLYEEIQKSISFINSDRLANHPFTLNKKTIKEIYSEIQFFFKQKIIDTKNKIAIVDVK